jgi:hypothetical protein
MTDAAMTGKSRPRPSEADLVREDVELVMGAVSMAADGFVLSRATELARCTASDRTALLLRFAVTWLLDNGLIVAAPDGAFDRTLAWGLPEPFAGDVEAKVREAVLRRARFDMAAAARR